MQLANLMRLRNSEMLCGNNTREQFGSNPLAFNLEGFCLNANLFNCCHAAQILRNMVNSNTCKSV